MKNKKGFSLIEVVVAIAILVTISVLAFGLVGGTRNVMFQSELKFKAANEAENIVKLYNLDKRKDDEFANLKSYFKSSSIEDNGSIILYENSNFVPVDSTDEAKYYEIVVELKDELIKKITFTNIKTGNSIYTYELRTS